MELSLELIVILILVAAFAGFIDTLAGGGGLIVLPALILAGIPPLPALGTNKLQSTMGTATASYWMIRSGTVRWTDVRQLMLSAFLGAGLGTVAVQFIRADSLAIIVPLILAVIAVYFAFSGYIARFVRRVSISDARYRRLIVPSIGFYDGMFGPGTGSFFAFAGVAFKGLDLIRATAFAKCMNFSTNFAALLVFIAFGQLNWTVGLLMMVGQFVGAFIGARTLVSIDPIYIRVLVVLMCLVMLTRYVYSYFNN
ncbi:MAG: putative membrane protein YfcA [Flavobacteriales bacterium]|jgi:uncharacterized membrane protein YfcA